MIIVKIKFVIGLVLIIKVCWSSDFFDKDCEIGILIFCLLILGLLFYICI